MPPRTVEVDLGPFLLGVTIFPMHPLSSSDSPISWRPEGLEMLRQTLESLSLPNATTPRGDGQTSSSLRDSTRTGSTSWRRLDAAEHDVALLRSVLEYQQRVLTNLFVTVEVLRASLTSLTSTVSGLKAAAGTTEQASPESLSKESQFVECTVSGGNIALGRSAHGYLNEKSTIFVTPMSSTPTSVAGSP